MSITNFNWWYCEVNLECVKLFESVEMWERKGRINFLSVICLFLLYFLSSTASENSGTHVRYLRDEYVMMDFCLFCIVDIYIRVFNCYWSIWLFSYVSCCNLAVFGIRWWFERQPQLLLLLNWVWRSLLRRS